MTVDHVTHPVDTGFLVFNHRTYPLLTRLFAELEVPIAASEMTFSVSLAGAWCGYGFHEDGLKAGLAAAEQVAASFAPTRYRVAA